MNQKIKFLFVCLIFTQGLHSVEEYLGKLWEVFAPATFLCQLVSNDMETGFLIINISLFVFGLVSILLVLTRRCGKINTLIWFWIILEIGNGLGHFSWSLIEKEYTPGLWTAMVLFPVGVYLAILMKQKPLKKYF